VDEAAGSLLGNLGIGALVGVFLDFVCRSPEVFERSLRKSLLDGELLPTLWRSQPARALQTLEEGSLLS
jgi:hypothetical protein